MSISLTLDNLSIPQLYIYAILFLKKSVDMLLVSDRKLWITLWITALYKNMRI